MTPQSQSLPGAPLRRRSTVVLLVRRDAPLAVPRTTLGESVHGDRRQLERWENVLEVRSDMEAYDVLEPGESRTTFRLTDTITLPTDPV